MEAEIGEQGNVKLTDEGYDRSVECAYSGERISSDDHRIDIRLESDGLSDIDHYLTHINISLDAIDEFRDTLKTGNEFEQGEIKRAYYRHGQGFFCLVCNHDKYVITEDHVGVVRVLDSSDLEMTFGGHLCWLHGDCADEFADVLDRAWEHAPDVLGDIV